MAGAPHDCLELHYAAETKLFLPVENIELLSRYGSDSANVELDRLGGSGFGGGGKGSGRIARDDRPVGPSRPSPR